MRYSKFSCLGCMLFPLSKFLNCQCNFKKLFFLKFQNTHKKLGASQDTVGIKTILKIRKRCMTF